MEDKILYSKEHFNQFCESYYSEIFHYVRKQTQNTEDAKDLTQDIFLKAYNKLNTYNPDKSSLRTWTYRIAYNHCINYFKSAYYKTKIDNSEVILQQIKSSEDILETLIQQEDIKEVIIIMKKVLNKKHLMIMNLYFFSELSPKEISDELNFNEKTVRNVISLSINKIKRRLEETYNE